MISKWAPPANHSFIGAIELVSMVCASGDHKDIVVG